MDAQPLAQARRPGTLVALVVLKVLNGLFGILTASLLLLSGLGSGAAALGLGAVVPALIMAFSLLDLFGAVGLWMLRRWARLLSLAVALLFTPLSAIGIVASGGRDPGTYLGVATGLLALAVLTRPSIVRLCT